MLILTASWPHHEANETVFNCGKQQLDTGLGPLSKAIGKSKWAYCLLRFSLGG